MWVLAQLESARATGWITWVIAGLCAYGLAWRARVEAGWQVQVLENTGKGSECTAGERTG